MRADEPSLWGVAWHPLTPREGHAQNHTSGWRRHHCIWSHEGGRRSGKHPVEHGLLRETHHPFHAFLLVHLSSWSGRRIILLVGSDAGRAGALGVWALLLDPQQPVQPSV